MKKLKERIPKHIQQTREFPLRHISGFKLAVFGVMLGVLCLQKTNAQNTIQAGTIGVESREGIGQGYLVEEPNGTLKIVTIKHVLTSRYRDGYIINTPGIGKRYAEQHRFSCDPINNYSNDTKCEVRLGAEMSQLLRNNEAVTYRRLRNHPRLRIGAIIGCPRVENGKWTVYQVKNIDSYTIELGPIKLDTDGDGVTDWEGTLGNICQGRSGGPMVMGSLTRSQRSGKYTFTPLLQSGHPISVGEMMGSYDTPRRDKLAPNVECFEEMIGIRVQ